VRVVRQYPPLPSFLVPEIPAAVDDIVARATAKDPAHRYPDGKSMAEDIEDVLAGRAARHRAAWSAPVLPLASSGTVADTDDPLAFLQSELGLGHTIAGSAARALMPTVELPHLISDAPTSDLSPDALPPGAPVARAARPRASMLAAALVLIATFAMGFSARQIDPASAVSAGRATAVDPITAAAPTPPPPARDAARLSIDVDHSLKQGRLRLWVDKTLRLDKRLGKGDVARVALRPRADGGRGGIEIEPGVHDVKVEVAWDDNVRTERVRATFRPGDRRVLAARLRGFFKTTLSLRWQ
jgi:serine/threonine-protein kinase